MIFLIKSYNSIIEDILTQQSLDYTVFEINQYQHIDSLPENSILYWDMPGLVSCETNLQPIKNFLKNNGKIILQPDENYKIYSHENKVDDVWKKFIEISNILQAKNSLMVLIEGKINQVDKQIKCTPIQFGYFESVDYFITNIFDKKYQVNKTCKWNIGTAVMVKPERPSRLELLNNIKNTELDTPAMMLTDQKHRKNIDKQSLPIGIVDSYCSLIIETEVDPYVTVISEKTTKPILVEKFWISTGDKNYYDTMEFLGFDTFRDIFDLSWIHQSDYKKRIDCLVSKLFEYNKKDFRSLDKSLRERIKNNKFNLAKAYAIDYKCKVESIHNIHWNFSDL